MTPVDQLIKKIEPMTMPDLLQFGSDRLVVLMGIASRIFAAFDEEDQGLALALLYGLLCADLEPKMCRIDNHLISFEDRLNIFRATASAAYVDYLKLCAQQTPAGKAN